MKTERDKIDTILEVVRRSPSFYKTFSGHFKLRDEPDENEQLSSQTKSKSPFKEEGHLHPGTD